MGSLQRAARQGLLPAAVKKEGTKVLRGEITTTTHLELVLHYGLASSPAWCLLSSSQSATHTGLPFAARKEKNPASRTRGTSLTCRIYLEALQLAGSLSFAGKGRGLCSAVQADPGAKGSRVPFSGRELLHMEALLLAVPALWLHTNTGDSKQIPFTNTNAFHTGRPPLLDEWSNPMLAGHWHNAAAPAEAASWQLLSSLYWVRCWPLIGRPEHRSPKTAHVIAGMTQGAILN